jgi:hypothetical protein
MFIEKISHLKVVNCKHSDVRTSAVFLTTQPHSKQYIILANQRALYVLGR